MPVANYEYSIVDKKNTKLQYGGMMLHYVGLLNGETDYRYRINQKSKIKAIKRAFWNVMEYSWTVESN